MTYNAEKFWEKVTVRGPRECWDWNGYTRPDGHPVWKGSGAHHMALHLQGQRVAKGYCVHHLCHNTGCVNPHHLQILRWDDHSRITRLERVGK